MSVKLHRCSFMFLKMDGHSCWKVQKALDEAGVDYEVVQEPGFPRGRRKEVIEKTEQPLLPVIETSDGQWIHAESKDLAERVRAGEFS